MQAHCINLTDPFLWFREQWMHLQAMHEWSNMFRCSQWLPLWLFAWMDGKDLRWRYEIIHYKQTLKLTCELSFQLICNDCTNKQCCLWQLHGWLVGIYHVHAGVFVWASALQLCMILLYCAFTNNFAHFFADIDECLSDPCLHGICTNTPASFKCTCLVGYTGVLCDESKFAHSSTLYQLHFTASLIDHTH